MIDFLSLCFSAFSYSIAAIRYPAKDRGLRRLQLATLTGTSLGIVLFVGAFVHIFVFEFAGPLWAILLVSSAVTWSIACCTGTLVDKRLKAAKSFDE